MNTTGFTDLVIKVGDFLILIAKTSTKPYITGNLVNKLYKLLHTANGSPEL